MYLFSLSQIRVQKTESCSFVWHCSDIMCFQRGWAKRGDTMRCNVGWYVWSPRSHINIVTKRFHRRYFIHERRMCCQYPFCSLQDLGLYVQWVKNPGTKSTKKEELIGVGRPGPQTFLNNSCMSPLKKIKNSILLEILFSYLFSFHWRKIAILGWFLLFLPFLIHQVISSHSYKESNLDFTILYQCPNAL